MPTRQAAQLAQTVAHALGVEAGPSVWSADLRRNGGLPTTLAALEEHLTDLARRVEVSMLPRDVRSLEALVAAEAFPVVVLAEPARGHFEGFVLERVDGAQVHGTQVAMDGVGRPVALPAAAVARGLIEQAARDQGGAAVATPEAALRVLVPVSVTPSVGAAHPVERPTTMAQGGQGLALGEAHAGQEVHGPTPMERLWVLLLREKRDVLLVFGYATIAGLFSLALPLGIQQIVQLVSGRMILQPTYILVAFVLVGTIVVGVLQLTQMSVVETIQQRVFARLALEFSFRVPRLRHEVSLREDLPEAMNRFFETVNIQKSLQKLLLDLPTALLTILFGLILLTAYHPYFTFFSAALVFGLAGIFWLTGPRGLATSIQESKYKYRAVHWLEEMARASTAFKYAGRSALPVERMDDLTTGYLKYRKQHFRVLVQQTASVIAFKVLIVGALLVLGIVLVQRNQITLGQFVASEIVIVTVLAGIEKLVLSLATVYDMLTAVDKIGHVTDLPMETPGGLALQASDPAHGRPHGLAIEVRGLTHRYSTSATAALQDIALVVAPGERVGITGYDGSGQTTLLKVLGGLVDGYDGALSINGVPMRDLDRVGLRDAIGQYLSATDLFDGTVEENITVGRPHITPYDVLRALGLVGLGRWIQEQPLGLRTPVTNGGRALATHVISRMLMAQAIVGDPRLVIVDDYYQNVEPDCRQALVQCLTDRAHPWTLLLVSHDPSFLAACDRVLVLENGRISREGPFERLVEESAFVQRLVRRAGALRA
ncbi:MAG TPA: ATP-binding cassette domain-containing protein [Gemmatirosa sp.]|nr:ATP-binding cassette domain-containing protein [Gemmatirosa sp.]